MADESNGASTAPAQGTSTHPPHPDFAKPPAKEGEVRPVWVMPEDWAATQNENRDLKAKMAEFERQRELEVAERQRQEAEKGGYEKAVTEIRTTFDRKLEAEKLRAQQIEEKWLGERRKSAIDEALAGKQFTGDPAVTARMLRQLLESEVEAVLGPNGEPQIRDRVTLRPAADYLKERLESPALGIFFKPSTSGGSGTDGTRPVATMSTGSDPFDAFAKNYRERVEAAKQFRAPR